MKFIYYLPCFGGTTSYCQHVDIAGPSCTRLLPPVLYRAGNAVNCKPQAAPLLIVPSGVCSNMIQRRLLSQQYVQPTTIVQWLEDQCPGIDKLHSQTNKYIYQTEKPPYRIPGFVQIKWFFGKWKFPELAVGEYPADKTLF